MNFFRSLRIDAVKQVLETAFILVIRKVHKLLEFLLKPVSKEAIMNPGDSSNVDTNYTEVLHLLG